MRDQTAHGVAFQPVGEFVVRNRGKDCHAMKSLKELHYQERMTHIGTDTSGRLSWRTSSPLPSWSMR